MRDVSRALRLSGTALGAALVVAVPGSAARPLLTIQVELVVHATGGSVAVVAPFRRSCRGTCSLLVTRGAALQVSAAPDQDHLFARWSGACVGTSPACLVLVGSRTTVTAVFTALPPPPATTAVTTTVTATFPTTTAPFTPPPLKPPRLAEINVTVSGPGTVTGGPHNRISCSGTSLLARGCHGSVARGSTIVLRAQAHSKHRFYRWIAGTCNARARCKLRITQSALVMAAFKE